MRLGKPPIHNVLFAVSACGSGHFVRGAQVLREKAVAEHATILTSTIHDARSEHDPTTQVDSLLTPLHGWLTQKANQYQQGETLDLRIGSFLDFAKSDPGQRLLKSKGIFSWSRRDPQKIGITTLDTWLGSHKTPPIHQADRKRLPESFPLWHLPDGWHKHLGHQRLALIMRDYRIQPADLPSLRMVGADLNDDRNASFRAQLPYLEPWTPNPDSSDSSALVYARLMSIETQSLLASVAPEQGLIAKDHLMSVASENLFLLAGPLMQRQDSTPPSPCANAASPSQGESAALPVRTAAALPVRTAHAGPAPHPLPTTHTLPAQHPHSQ